MDDGVVELEIDTQLLTSVAIIAVTIMIGELIRYAVKITIPEEERLIRIYLLEIAIQFERVAVTVETFFVYGVYGLIAFYLLLVFTNVWRSIRWDWEPITIARSSRPTARLTVSVASDVLVPTILKSNICGHLIGLMDGTKGPLEVLAFTALETVVSFLAYPLYISPLWRWFDNQPDRGARVHGGCVSEMKGGLLYASLAEGGGSFIIQFVALAMLVLVKHVILRALIQTTIVFLITIAFVNVSGSYFNPPVATADQTGCEQVVLYEHLLCYWVAPIVGAVLGVLLYRRASSTLERKRD